jgi:PAS domain S-box-containing protein
MKDIRPAEDVPVFLEYVAPTSDLPPRVWRHRKKDGTMIFVEVTMQPVALGGGTALLALANDVTARIGAEKTRSRAETTLLIAQRIARLGNWYWNIETGELYWSTEIYRLFGVPETSAGVTYETFLAAIHPEDRERVEQAIRDALDRRASYDLDHRVLRPDGTVLIVHEQGEVTRGSGGKALRMIGTVQDVTKRRQAEAELREAEEQARKQASLLNLTHDAILVGDLQDRLTFWNRGAEHLYGWKKEEVLGRPVTEFLYGDVAAFAKAKQAVLARGEWNGELRQLKNDGGEVVVACRWTLVRNEQGEAECIISINSDLTEQKKLEQQFLRAQRLESIGTLASGVAHDLNNVLVPILMVAPLLRGEVSSEEREKFLTIVEASAQRGANIVRQVLTFARGAEGDRLLLQPIHLLEEISNIIRGTFPKSITVHASYPETVSPIEGDPTQLHQVLLNLAVNARDAMPQGGTLTLSASNLNLDEYYAGMAPGIVPGPYVLLQVRDSGTGIPREIIDKIFDPFFTTKEIGVGTGLGLSTVVGIVKSHGGFVNVDSQPGETIFKIFLPAADTAQELEMPRATEPIASGHGEKILIVDDEPGIREIARALLEKHGYEPVVAEDGPSALATFARHPREFKVVLTDMAIPIIDGVTLIRAMRKINPDIKAILSTGSQKEGQAGNIQALGVQACLTKPYTRDTLFETLHQVLKSE